MPNLTTEIEALSIDWHFPEGIKGCFATHLAAQHTEGVFILSFFEPIVPVVAGEGAARKARISQITEVRANCVARVVVPASRLPDLIQVLQENLHHYQEALGVRAQAEISTTQ